MSCFIKIYIYLGQWPNLSYILPRPQKLIEYGRFQDDKKGKIMSLDQKKLAPDWPGLETKLTYMYYPVSLLNIVINSSKS